jgi:Zn-finger nucleic acid-binding protein
MIEFREGARYGYPTDLCPKCGLAGVLTFNFRKFGKHTMHHCPTCSAIYVDGQLAALVENRKEG